MDKLPTSPGRIMPPAPPAAAPRQPAPPARRTRRRRTLVIASTTAIVLGALVLVRYASAPPLDDVIGDESTDRLEQTADATPASESWHAIPPSAVASAGIVAAPPAEEHPLAPVVK